MSKAITRNVLTIGHSTLSYEDFLKKLQMAGVNAVADVRSVPFSRHYPHFNGDELRKELRTDNIAYVFLGDELGGRPRGSGLFCDGVADYEKMAETISFKKGIDRVIDGSSRFKVALMCSEHDPLDCHRCLLVGRALVERGLRVRHILSNDQQWDHDQAEEKLLSMIGKSSKDLFLSNEDRRSTAYRERSRKVAFSMSGPIKLEARDEG